MEKLRVCIAGCGNIFTMHSTSVASFKDAELVGVCDIKPDRAQRAAEKYGATPYTDYKVMLAEQKPDILHVCLPHYLHPIVSKYAIQQGINVLCEKPISIKMEDALENAKLAKEKGVLYGIIFQCRYNTASQTVKKCIEDGTLGRVLSARSVLTWCKPDSYYSLSDWKGTWDKEGGGVVIDQAIHSMDLVNWFVDSEPKSVYAHYDNRDHEIMQVDDSAEGLIKYKNGVNYGFWAMNNYGVDEPIEIRLVCENGKAVLSYDDVTITLNDGTVITNAQDMTDSLEYENGKDYWGFQHVKQIRQFYNSVKGEETLEISAEEALKIQKIICAVYESSRQGKPIEF
ncbi:MAG: Gfo/Idh/MocA family oxidoreductase [Ruminococcaceae bacterium]|nr:Gfo/Idh/MocA family oxidoreductase [Oscillospiraceae bacterium]